MAGDNLFAILDMIRAEMPEISDESWDRIKRAFSQTAPGERLYVPAQRKRSHLELLATLSAEADAQQIAKVLGVSVRQAQRLKRLR